MVQGGGSQADLAGYPDIVAVLRAAAAQAKARGQLAGDTHVENEVAFGGVAADEGDAVLAQHGEQAT